MTVGKLDRRTAVMFGLGVAAILVIRFGIYGDSATEVVAAGDSVPAAEARLERLRRIAAMAPARRSETQRARAELAEREKGLIVAETPAQAQEQLLQIVRRTGEKEGIDVRGAEELKIAALGADYGEVSVTVSFTCAIEQFVNFMAALAGEPQLVSTREVHVSAGNPKQKTIQVRLAVSGAVPKNLVPVKKGPALF
jgi:hypothetical protein